MTSRILVEAGAGCGKTTSIVETFAKACRPKKEEGLGLNPRDIILLTFTEAAATEMRERIQRDHPQISLAEAQISTFHAYCLKLIREHFTSISDLKILSENEAAFKLKDALLQIIDQSSKKELLLKHLTLHQVVDLILFNNFNKQNFESEFEELKNKWSHFKENTLKKLSASSLDDIEETEWPHIFLKVLSQKEDLKFRFSTKKTLKTYSTENPGLREAAEIVKDLLSKSIFGPIFELIDLEKQLLEALLSELSSLQSRVEKELPSLLTFSEIERLCLQSLEERNASTDKKLLNKPRFIIVDEFQDTSPEQWRIIESLSSENTDWYLVGDPKQSIYGFRKADIRIYQSLKSKLELKKLATNYRSSERLLNILNDLQASCFTSIDDPEAQSLSAGKTIASSDNPCRIYEGSQVSDENLLEIIKHRNSEKDALRHGVLFREWTKLFSFARFLKLKKVPFKILGSENVLDHALTHHFLEWIKSCFFIKEEYRESHLKTINGWCTLKVTTDDLTKVTQENDTLQCFYAFKKHFEALRWPLGAEWAAAIERLLGRLHDINITTAAETYEILKKGNFESPPLFKPLSEETPTLNITLMTIHGSKGLEFDCVYLPDPRERIHDRAENEDDEIPFQFAINSQKKSRSLYFELKNIERKMRREAEQKRLFYVAITRAIYSLDLFIPPPPSNDTTSKVEANTNWWAIWNKEDIARFKWSQVISKLIKNKDCEWVNLDELGSESSTTQTNGFDEEDSDSPPQTFFKIKNIKSESPKPFHTGGVTQYLEKTTVASKAELAPSTNATFLPNAINWGTYFHAAIEKWNGSDDLSFALSDIPPSFHADISKSLFNLKKAKELDFFFSELSNEVSSQKIYRECPVLICSPDFELSGKIDALYFEGSTLTIIDWKTTSSLKNFTKDRILKHEEQLRLYATSFQKTYKKIRLLVVGVTISESKVVLDKTFSLQKS